MDAGGRRHPRPRAPAGLRSPPLPSRAASCSSTSVTLWAGHTQHRLDPLGIGWTLSASVGQRCSVPGREVRTREMRPHGPRALLLLLLLVAGPGQLSAQVMSQVRPGHAEVTHSPKNCLNKQQVLTAIRQLQQLLKVQETRFSEGLRSVRSRLAALQSSANRVGLDGPPVSCPALNAPPDGRKFGSKYLVDHEVHFTCDPGFQLVGPSSVVCLPNGTWTGEQPRCRAGPERLADDPAFSRAPRCAQVERTRHCSCEAGFQLSRAAGGDSVCQDVNECELYRQEGRPRLCMHTCVNTPGSYRCACPSGYRTLPDRKSCEDVDECVSPQHLCPRGTTCINTGGGFQCVSPECPESSGNVSYVKTSPFQCERNPCPMDSRPCRHLPKTISFHYLSLPSNLTTPITLFRMAMASVPGRPGPNSLRFGIVGGNSRGHFVMQRADRQTGELILVQTLEGPQTLEVDVDMSEYLDRSFQANHVSKVTIFVSPYDF
ncbi:fibulin-7 isoform X1 [Phyllostomus discolor]|uniref:Fibulin-7 isoform X1 n=1 Tax=Phyllostomus discolor TaxID=89673 RepID=A0A7E6DYB2_9CHIR|nr:fibulin-7 isoform X1 [Phyllostomus discolor]